MKETLKNMSYWELRDIIVKLVPRMSKFPGKDGHKQKEKGRKSNYKEFNILNDEWVTMERLLNPTEINSFAEVSLRAQSCPMPFNVDLWDGLRCPFRCRYCFADYFRHSLYTSFFDGVKQMGLRHNSEEKFTKELDKLMPYRGEVAQGNNEVINAVRLEIPIRLGIRFEDFCKAEARTGVSLALLRYLKEHKYPVMVNTKSDLVGMDAYVREMADNVSENGTIQAAVHTTLISSDEAFLKDIEPGAPTFKARIKSMKALTDAGVRSVARVEPFMPLLNDDKVKIDEYIGALKEAGVTHMTWDTYSYSAKSQGLAANFAQINIDFHRMFLLSSDSQWLSSILLGKMMEYFREHGIYCSTFDQGNVADNNDWICCSVGDLFTKAGAGFNWGSGVVAAKFIKSRGEAPTSWAHFDNFVIDNGGWLSDNIKFQVKQIWNGDGDQSWPLYWGRGMIPVGSDEHGIVWKYEDEEDYRYQLLESLLIGGRLF